MSGGGYKISDQYGLYFLTFTICGWVDVFTRKETKQIHYNPVRAGFVDYPEEYPYSSYRNYYEESRLTFNLPIEILYLKEE